MSWHLRGACEKRRCRTCRDMRRATVNLLTNPRARLCGNSPHDSDPVLWADAQTSYHDLRAALCLAAGATLDEIDPVTGHYLGKVR